MRFCLLPHTFRNDLSLYEAMETPFDPYKNAVPDIIYRYIERANYSLTFTCDRESVAVAHESYFEVQQCFRNGNLFQLTVSHYHYWLQQFNVPASWYGITAKYIGQLSYVSAPYFVAIVPLGILNVIIIHQVARECPGVRYHLAQTIGDVVALVCGLVYLSKLHNVFAPLFAWHRQCQSLAESFFGVLECFFQVFSLFALTLLTHDRYLIISFPNKYEINKIKMRKFVPWIFALPIIPAMILFASAFWTSTLSAILELISTSVLALYYAVCLCVIAYCSTKTAIKSRNYQAPVGSSNAAESIAKMKRFYRLTTRVLILNSAYTMFLFVLYLNWTASTACRFVYLQKRSWAATYSQGFCKFYNDLFGNFYSAIYWKSQLSIFSSNIGLIFHSMFSYAYRNEVIRLFKSIAGFARHCKFTTTVISIEGGNAPV